MKNFNLTAIVLAIFISYLFLLNPWIAFSVLLAGILILISIKSKIENFLLFFIIVYPIMPFHAGLDLGAVLPVIKLHRVLILLLIICWLSKKKSFPQGSFFQFPLTKLLTSLLLVYFISFVSKLSIKDFIFYSATFVLENFMIMYIFYDVFKSKTIEDAKKIYLCLAISMLFPLSLGILEWAKGFNPFSFIAPYREVLEGATHIQERFGIGRVRAAFPHPIDYGVFFSMIMPAGLLFFNLGESVKSKKKNSYIYTGFLLCCFLGAYLSLSRLALLIFLIVALIVSFYLSFIRTLFISGLTFLIFMIQPLFLGNIRDKVFLLFGGILGYGYTNSEIMASSVARTHQMQINWNKILEAPFIGHGGTYDPGIIDNYYLTLVLKSGIIGTSLYLLFFIIPGVMAFSMFFRSRSKPYKSIALCTLVVISANLLVFSVLSITEYLYLTWIYLGLFMAVREIYKGEKNNA